MNQLFGRRFFSTQSMKQLRNVFQKDGYAVLNEFFSHDRVDELKVEMGKIIDGMRAESEKNKAIFTTSNGKQIEALNKSADFFLDSSANISHFYEKGAFDENGNLKQDLSLSINKVGHALHDLNPVFEKFCYSVEMKQVCSDVFEFISPVLVQTMYIFKSKKIGGEVNPHQDHTYIRSSPLSCKGIWVALEDADQHNGCLWGVPGSHKVYSPITYSMKQRKNEEGAREVYHEGEKENYDISKAVPLEVKKGSVVLLDGGCVHYSGHNYSEDNRHAFTMHIVEGRNTKWDADNWLIRPDNFPFRLMNSVIP